MKLADVVLTTSIQVRSAPVKPGMRATFKSSPGHAMVFIACGSVDASGDQHDQARRVLEYMGWQQLPAAEGQDGGIEAAVKGGA